MNAKYDVIVVGGGHAGVEAANAAARLGASVLLITSNIETIGQMSCNPAIGGIAKGTVVREVDAMGGIMGKAADRATIQFRMLNSSKGPAVWAPRAQCDRVKYRLAVRELLEESKSLEIKQDTVATLTVNHNRIGGVKTTTGEEIEARAVVLAAGTFLRGRIYMGTSIQLSAGRAGDAAANELAEQLEALGLKVDRFKTGTPPRIDGRSVDYGKVEEQKGEMPEYRFAHYDLCERGEQRSCWVTWTGERLKQIISDNLQESALFGGAIAGRGPRYCPSIEDKITRFPDAERHQVFLEPEGLHTHELYVNGLSTSLPPKVQLEYLRSVPGLENVVMTRPGYAIEYDYYPPEQLEAWLEVKQLRGLFFAGQVNGTTGYEEAGGQGFVAGVNAVRTQRSEDLFLLERDKAYTGVLIDDLITKGVDEPYRLFTSRAEFRLLLRQDNSIRRLGQLACELGTLTEEESERVGKRLEEEDDLAKLAAKAKITLDRANRLLATVGESSVREPQRIEELVKRPGIGLKAAVQASGSLIPDLSADVWTTAEIELKYAGYLKRERSAVLQLQKMVGFELDNDLPYDQMLSLSTEARQKLLRIKPMSLAQAARIPGVSPSDLQNLVSEVLKRRKPNS
ncbi:MAG: tRNA uridine-5-carboxymethylaminomethyl(34) synthesis enzyme MnmG [Myxococcota bacterium]|nr:tRNA uridine-5-carboxymethylaminomethyl(34) synthesis enzyme MnmG [Myxococcota bacterium]